MRRIFIFMALLFLFPTLACAQYESGTLVGTVTDPTGAVVPGALVEVVQQETSVKLSTTTDSTGNYLFGALRIGAYDITVTATGFRVSVEKGVRIGVSERRRVDFLLQLGSAAERVEVVAALASLQTESGAVGQSVEQRQIEQLPLNGRDYKQLVLLAAGAVARPGVVFGGFNVNGNRIFQNNFLLDGVDNNGVANNTRGGVEYITPPVDSIEEFRVQTNSYSAEYGRGAGAVVNVSFRAGANRFRGEVYEFLRNSALDARNFFARAGAPRKQNQFGANFGGPILRNRTFFFGDYEGLRIRQAQSLTGSVPSAAARSGDFAGRRPIYDPDSFNPATGSRQPFPNNRIPPERLHPIAAKLVALYPAFNVPGRENLSNNFTSNPGIVNRTEKFDMRVDHHFSSKASLFGRYSFFDEFFIQPNVFTPVSPLAEGGERGTGFARAPTRAHNLALGFTYLMGPRALNEFRGGFGRTDGRRNSLNTGKESASALSGIPGLPDSELVNGGLPRFEIQGLTNLGRPNFVPQFQIPRTYTLRDAQTWLAGRHSLKFGFEHRHTQVDFFDINAMIGHFVFNGSFTAQTPGSAASRAATGEPLADFLLGRTFQANLTLPARFLHFQRFYYAFVQDDWKVTPNLTLNLGLRYEYGTPLREVNNRYANFDPARAALVQARDGSLESRALVKPDRNNWAPRVGFAYSLGRRTVLRGAYGVFYNIEDRRGSESILSYNPSHSVDAQIISDRVTPALDLSRGLPPETLDPARVNLANVRLRVQAAEQPSAYVQQWNLTWQAQLPQDTLFSLGYVGNKGTKLGMLRNLNQAAPGAAAIALRRPFFGFGDIQWFETRANSSYNALQAAAEKRFSRGYSLLVSYTWSHTLSEAEENLSRTANYQRNPQNSFDTRPEHGPANFDYRHLLNVGYLWELPFGRGKKLGRSWRPVAEAVLGGWQLNGIFSYRSGQPVNVTLASGQAANLGGERSPRPDALRNPNLPEGQRTPARWFDIAAFAVPTTTFGNAGRGIVRGPSRHSLDFGLMKTFRLRETTLLEWRAEFFNLTNTPPLNAPAAEMGGSGFGAITTADPARQIQLSLKLKF